MWRHWEIWWRNKRLVFQGVSVLWWSHPWCSWTSWKRSLWTRYIGLAWKVRLPDIQVQVVYSSQGSTLVLFSNRAAEGENLPPASGALSLHIFQANFVTMVWKSATLNHLQLSSPVKFGWMFDDQTNLYIPSLCLNKPAPEALLKLLRCYCKTWCH